MLSSAVLVLTASMVVGHNETVSGNQHLSFFEPYVGTWTWSGALPEDMPFGKKGESGSGCLNWKWQTTKLWLIGNGSSISAASISVPKGR